MTNIEHKKYLQKINFQKRLNNLSKTLKNKTIIIYGAGSFFESIVENYNIKTLNIIGLADKKFSNHTEGETFLEYKVYSPKEIKELNPDYVLTGTLMVINTIEELESTVLKDTKIKIKPLIKKTIRELWSELWTL